jgi:TrmH family RNA methyltransferase
MTSEPVALSRIVFILDRPREIANIGAVVRILGNFGLTHLRLVEPSAFDPDRVLRFASRGSRVAAAVRQYERLADALADCALVLGATRRPRSLERPVLTPREAAPRLVGFARDQLAGGQEPADAQQPAMAAVLFGPEDFGLSNDALDRCNAILSIPTAPNDQSLNLAQATAIVAYEIYVASTEFDETQTDHAERSYLPAPEHLARGAELEELFEAIRQTLIVLHAPTIEGRTRNSLKRLRAMLLRADPRQDEVLRLTELFNHIAHRLER